MNTKKNTQILKKVGEYYTDKILQYGANNEGVDWSSAESQTARFDQLLKVMGSDTKGSILDYGCGYGALATHMRSIGYDGSYLGFDISKQMIAVAKKEHAKILDCSFETEFAWLPVVDYTLASGIFNVKHEVSHNAWHAYVIDTIDEIAKHSSKGFAFNMLTNYSDTEKMRSDLYYGDPRFFLDHCIRLYSRRLTLHHLDYGLWEFTILVHL
jgi:SAM-dependent methyltransferase